MGLDMFAHSYDPTAWDDKNNRPKDGIKGKELWYWRKHHDLHGFMESLYRSRGGKDDFNLEFVRLTLEDLDKLAKTVKEYRLPATVGFFFGNNPPDEESNADDLKFIAAARKEIKKGRIVAYTSWW